ncbi:hypothetical protein ACFOOL_06405 [Devosia honganensis]|uniref:Uncharacterized protein n=1 Tax=Devosia honganensis TaxID=1610527 RepID=A0ABV7WYN1_9HYPH
MEGETGTNPARRQLLGHCVTTRGLTAMNSIIYLVGLVVIVMAILSFIGLA